MSLEHISKSKLNYKKDELLNKNGLMIFRNPINLAKQYELDSAKKFNRATDKVNISCLA